MSAPAGSPVLQVRGVSKVFGGLTAVKDLTMDVRRGALYGLIGPNGAGKTTVFNLLTGVYDPTEGEIVLDGKRINGKPAFEIAKLGMARTFQNIRLFSDMSVLENVMAARHLRSRQTMADAVLGTPRHHTEERQARERALELLRIFNLEHVADEHATSLPYGSQRRLEIARALATDPQVLLLDEPAAGMNPQESAELMDLIRWLRDECALTVVLVEHNMKVVMGICEIVQVIDHGEVIAVGTPDEVQKNPDVIEAYLGGGYTQGRPVLTLEHVDVFYGAIHALRDISIVVHAGEVVTLIGANGAGKSTTLRAITGLIAPKRGRVDLDGQDINGVPAHARVVRGISMAPEGRGVFANLTVLENLEMGAYVASDRAKIKQDIERGFTLFPRLKERQKQRAGTLSGGEQQMLAIARALMSRPKLLLLDEPSLGLAPIVCQTIFATIDEIKAAGVTVLLVEQNARAALKHSDRAYVLETGAIILEGPATDVASNPRVREAYLGE